MSELIILLFILHFLGIITLPSKYISYKTFMLKIQYTCSAAEDTETATIGLVNKLYGCISMLKGSFRTQGIYKKNK